MPAAAYLVFSQSALAPSVGRVVQGARSHFGAALVAVGSDANAETAGVRLSYTAHGESAVFDVDSRRSDEDDVRKAGAAERGATGAGLADLAARCSVVWTVAPPSDAPEWLVVEFCALLASVALGPILPPDASRLLGVRSARERSNALRGADALTR